MARDGANGAFVAWTGFYDGILLLQRVLSNGLVPAAAPLNPPSIQRWTIHGPFPNPSAAGTRVSLDSPDGAPATGDVFDITGRWVGRLVVEDHASRGTQTLDWDARDIHGQLVPGGCYVLRIQDGLRSGFLKLSIVR
jgi:hypothetical protein